MRRNTFRLRPQVEGLESMTLLSGASAAAVVHAAGATPITLRGTVSGSYLAQRDPTANSAKVQLAAGGTVTPLASRSTLSAIARIPSLVTNGQIQGTVTIRGIQGSITLRIAGVLANPPSTTQRVSYGLGYTITGATGQFVGVGGHGIIIATFIPKSNPSHKINVGTVVLTFR